MIFLLTNINLAGEWKLQLDGRKEGLSLPFIDSMDLPGTTSHARKGPKNVSALVESLTDEYLFEGYAWFSREIDIPMELVEKNCFLYLERTRMTRVWINDVQIGSSHSLNAPHLYDLTGHLSCGSQTLTICVNNTDYPTKGGHMTSPDTQTNWNGITGRMELQFFSESYLSGIQIYPNISARSIEVIADMMGEVKGKLFVSASSLNSANKHDAAEQVYDMLDSKVSITYDMGPAAMLWSEAEPNLYQLKVVLQGESGEVLDRQEITFGLREFKAEGDKFTINGEKTFLRGKHDGLIFPLTGFAPTDLEDWISVLSIAKSYGINHYRFHTCCPPEAAFTAADMLGIYMEPELPFWGTITEASDEGHNPAEQEYLIQEGYAILKAFGNHPSFVMMSLGNELWGSRSTIDAILKAYKSFDNRRLYTQGSNNHQFIPEILEHDDFFCGVRFSKERLIRGSYAMCDAPLGNVQTLVPNTLWDYDEMISPANLEVSNIESNEAGDTIQIQYGTEAKNVKVDDIKEEWIPEIPVISHEIGQYATFPNFDEIQKYTGSLKAKNFEIFRERLEEKGMGHLAAKFFECSGQLAVACYKEELEAAFRSKKLAGFQLLDLQDFSGQGTALVGMLDAFMDSKGLIEPDEWRTFCNDAVLMARFSSYNCVAEEQFHAHVELSWFRNDPPKQFDLKWELAYESEVWSDGSVTVTVPSKSNYLDLCDLNISLPRVNKMCKVNLNLSIVGTDVRKTYPLWIYPKQVDVDFSDIHHFDSLTSQALSLLEAGENVLLMPKPEHLSNAIEGYYCTDFWCYPMFRSISESMNRPVPVGTMGLVIAKDHPVFANFPSDEFSTYPWWNIVSNAKSIIMDGVSKDWSPIVQSIDNFERNHKLGLLFECRVGKGKLLISAIDAEKVCEVPEGRQFLSSIITYMKSNDFNPQYVSDPAELLQLIR
ncbi:glycoside hydrolase family 2 TIM barrel-domain containing protein [Paenibacillus sp. RS8]|uniref:glycoside hydrolase family 2 TIM barrel-domain containing protein n=1 Tax=Paenibacillus sp. RS8 TaxID=3242681 RepID=UPI0035C22241